MPKRPKHPDPEGEKVLRTLEGAGWTFKRGKKYYNGRCPCGEHMTSLYITPSNDSYFRQKITRLKHYTCLGGKGASG